MAKLPDRVERKKTIWRRYRDGLAGVSQVNLFDIDLKHCVPWFIDVRSDSRSELQEHLKSRGIGSRVMYPPINDQMCYQVKGHFPVSADIGVRGLWLPSASQLSDAQVDRICAAIREFY